MAVEAEVIRFAANTTSGIQTITTSFEPKGAIFLMGSATADATETADIYCSIGFSDGTNGIVVGNSSEDGLSSSDCYQGGKRAGEVILQRDVAGGAIIAEASIDSFNATSVKINWTNPPSSAYLVTMVIFGGSDVQADAGTFLSNSTEDATTDVTTGFRSDLIFFLMDIDHFQYTPLNLRSQGMGACDSSLNQAAFSWYEKDNVITQECRAIIRNDRCAIANLAAADGTSIEITAIGSSSFTVASRDSIGGARYGYLALNLTGASTKVRSTTSPSSTGTVDDTSFGFTPIFCMHFQSMISALNNLATAGIKGAVGDCYTIGTFTASDLYSNCWYADDGNTTMGSKHYTNSEPMRMWRGDGLDAIRAEVPVGGVFSANGVKLNWSTVDIQAGTRQYFQVAFANDPIPDTEDVRVQYNLQEPELKVVDY